MCCRRTVEALRQTEGWVEAERKIGAIADRGRVVKHAVGSVDDRFVVAERLVGEANTWLEVVGIIVEDAGAGTV